jgi:exosortase B
MKSMVASSPIQLASILMLTLGFFAIYLPSYYSLSKTVWSESDEMHGPIVLAVAIWALYSLRGKILSLPEKPNHFLGWPLLCLGAICFLVGKGLGILVLEIGSQVIVLSACLLLLSGASALRLALFPLVFLVFMVPLPGNLVDSMTGSLKQVVSVIAEQLLYWMGYPIARSGVMLTIGQYQLLVADACSGLKSMFSLSAIGFLYIYLVGYKRKTRNALLIAALLPIAFVANIMRVMVLILVTYHFGDAAGQGFVHDFAGMALFIFAVLVLTAYDSFLGLFFKKQSH